MASSRPIDTIVDEAILEAKKQDPYHSSVSPQRELFDKAFDALKPLLTNALNSSADNKAIKDEKTSLSNPIIDALKQDNPTTIRKALSDKINGIAPGDIDAFTQATITAIPGGQALEAIKKKADDKNGFPKTYQESKLAEELMPDLAKDIPASARAKAIHAGIKYLAKNAPKESSLANPDGKDLATFVTNLFDPTHFQTVGAIAKALMSPPVTKAAPANDPADFTNLDVTLTKMAEEILKINDHAALIRLQNKLNAEVKKQEDQIPAIIKEAKAVEDAITASLAPPKDKILPDTIAKQLKQSKQTMLDHQTALENLKEECALIQDEIKKIDSYATSSNPAEKISDKISKLGIEILKTNQSIADHGKKHEEAIKAPIPDASWVNLPKRAGDAKPDQIKLENDFLTDTLNIYELFYRLYKSAEGDANAHAQLENAKAAVKNIQDTLNLKVGVGKEKLDEAATDELKTAIENMAARFGQLYRDMDTLSQKKFDQLEMERYYSPTPPKVENRTATELKEWANSATNSSSLATAITTVAKVKSGVTDNTPKPETLGSALGIGTDTKTVTKKDLVTKDNYVKLYDGSNGTSSVFSEKKDFRHQQKSYELNVYDLPESISDRGLLNQFLTEKMKTMLGKSLTFQDAEGNELKTTEIKKLIFDNLPAVITEIDMRRFLNAHVRVSGRTDNTLVSKFQDYLSGKDESSPRVQKVTYKNESGTTVKSGWLPGRLARAKEVVIPSPLMLEQARLFLNTITASGCKSPAFESDNPQLVLAMQIVAKIAGVTVEFAYGAPKPSDEQIAAVKSPITSNKSKDPYIDGLSSTQAPAKVVEIANAEYLPRAKAFKAAAGEAYKLAEGKPVYPERRFGH